MLRYIQYTSTCPTPPCCLSLCLQAPGMVRKLPNFVTSLFEALMTFLLDIEDDPDWHRVSESLCGSEGLGG